MIPNIAIGFGANEISPDWLLLIVPLSCLAFAVPVLWMSKRVKETIRDNILTGSYVLSAFGVIVSAATSSVDNGLLVPVAIVVAFVAGGFFMWPVALIPTLIAWIISRGRAR